MVERVKDLCLNGIVMGELIEALILPVTQCGHGQWLEVQELCKITTNIKESFSPTGLYCFTLSVCLVCISASL